MNALSVAEKYSIASSSLMSPVMSAISPVMSFEVELEESSRLREALNDGGRCGVYLSLLRDMSSRVGTMLSGYRMVLSLSWISPVMSSWMDVSSLLREAFEGGMLSWIVESSRLREAFEGGRRS